MRKVKFNAWNKVNNTMHMFINSPENWSFSFLDQDFFVWLEWTGRKDKHGIEICEGDIVKTDSGAMRKVVYRADMSRFVLRFNTGASTDIMNDCTVVGNIYQHPELLK